MHTNRMSPAFESSWHPQSPEPGVSAAAFVLLPLSCLPEYAVAPAAQCQLIYQQALEMAKAVVGPSLPERDLLGFWN